MFQLIAYDVATSRSCHDICFSTLQSSIVCLMSRHQDVVATLLHVFCSLPLVVVMSRPQSSCRDSSSGYCTFERVSPDVVTSASWNASFNRLFLVSRHQSSCHDSSLSFSISILQVLLWLHGNSHVATR